MSRITSASCALCAAVTLFVAFEAAAKTGGVRFGGVRTFHAAAHPGAHRLAHRFPAHRRFPLLNGTVLPYGYGYYDPYFAYASGYADDGQTGDIVIVRPPEPPRVLTCQRNQVTVTVPSEFVGTREITVTRC